MTERKTLEGSDKAIENTLEGLRTVINTLRKRHDELSHERQIQGELIGKCKQALRQIRKSASAIRSQTIAGDMLDEI